MEPAGEGCQVIQADIEACVELMHIMISLPMGFMTFCSQIIYCNVTALGDGWLYGLVDKDGEFTGQNIAYIYSDMTLSLVGEFKHGKMVSVEYFTIGSLHSLYNASSVQVSGQRATVVAEKCNENGVKMLLFSGVSGPVYHYNRQKENSLGDDPLEGTL